MNKILYIIQLPPPLHGVSLMNSYVLNSNLLQEYAVTEVIDLKFSKSIQGLEKFSFFKVYTALKYSLAIFRKMRKYKPETVYFTLTPTGFGFYRDAFYVLILKLFRAKILLHLHGKGIQKNISSSIKKALYQKVFNNTYIICLSKILANDIKDVYNGQPFFVPNGIANRYKAVLQKSRTKRSVLKILYVSNFIRNKGVLVLVEALFILNKKGYEFNVRFVGAPSDVTIELLTKAIEEKGLADCATVLGPLYGDAKFEEFENADIFVFPTYNDSFPLVILEAMQYSLPVISTYEGSIPDIVLNNETGFLVEKQNAVMLAEKIGVLLKDENLRIQMGVKGYERFLSNYTLQHFELHLLQTFRSVLAGKQNNGHYQY